MHVYGIKMGTQPDGYMDPKPCRTSCSGYEGFGSIVINYYFPSGKNENGYYTGII